MNCQDTGFTSVMLYAVPECNPEQWQWDHVLFQVGKLKMTVSRWWNLIHCRFPPAADPVVKGTYCNVVFTVAVSICHAALAVFIDKPDLFHHRNTGFASICRNLSSIIIVK